MVTPNSIRRLKRSDLEVDRTVHPRWKTGADRTPKIGEEVFCTAGMATVENVLGRTGDGSRLLELRLPVDGAKPFFAAASNVLVQPKRRRA